MDYVEASQQASMAVTDCDGFLVAYFQEEADLGSVGVTAGCGLGLRRQATESERLEGKLKLAHALADLLEDEEMLSCLAVALSLSGRGQAMVLKVRECLSTPGADGRRAHL